MSSDSQPTARTRWWRRGLISLAALAAVALAYPLISGAGSSGQLDSKLTHTVKRGDLVVTVTKQGLVESAENEEVKCKVRGRSTVIWVIDSGTYVEPGDELVRLDTLFIEESLAERTKYAHWSRSAAERGRANVATAELAISEYKEGRYLAELMEREKEQAVAESTLRTAKDMLDYTRALVERGYQSDMELEEKELAVTRAELNLEVKKTEIDVLKKFTQAMESETLKGNFNAAKANLAASEERALMDATRRDLAREELDLCVVKAEQSGLVIHPNAARWHNAPEIAEGATVHKDQVLLLMPDLSTMQVKLGIHESHIDRVKPGLAARVSLPNRALDGEVSTVASVTAPPGIWTGYKVEYETTVALPSVKGPMPGMSAEVEIVVDRHENVLTIPVAAVVETANGDFCWVKTSDGVGRRSLQLGDTNDVFTIVTAGLKEGDQVMLNPFAFMDEAEVRALKSSDQEKPSDSESAEPGTEPKPKKTASPTKAKPQKPGFSSKPESKEPNSVKKPGGSPKPKISKPKAAQARPETGDRRLESVVQTSAMSRNRGLEFVRFSNALPSNIRRVFSSPPASGLQSPACPLQPPAFSLQPVS